MGASVAFVDCGRRPSLEQGGAHGPGGAAGALGTGGVPDGAPASSDAGTTDPESIDAGASVAGDGKPDVIAGGPMGVDVALNQGDGTLGAHVAYAAGGSVFGAAAGDLDGDGQIDLVVANPDGQRMSALFGQGGATFGPPIPWGVVGNPWSLVAADFDSDGQIDLAVANHDSHDVTVFLNQTR